MNTGSRIDDMIEIVARIAEITTHLVPDEEGMVIRFLNSYRTEAELYRKYGKIRTAKEATSMISAAKYDRDTRLGAHLEADVLKPYIYDFIDNGKKLERPLLISIITDGCVSLSHLQWIVYSLLIFRLTISQTMMLNISLAT